MHDGLGDECVELRDHGGADLRDVGEHAAGVGDAERAGDVWFGGPQLGEGYGNLLGELFAGLLEEAVGERVAVVGAAGDDGSKFGEVGAGLAVAEGDEIAEGVEFPELLDVVEEGRHPSSVAGVEGDADGVAAEPVAGALVAEYGSPAAGTVEGAGGGAGDDVGAGAGDDQDAGAAGEGAVEGDLLVAAEQEVAGDGRGHGALGPVADGGDGEAGEADAGAGDLAERDGGGGGGIDEQVLQALGGDLLGDPHELDGAGGAAGEDAVVIGEEALGLGSTGVDCEVQGHGQL